MTLLSYICVPCPGTPGSYVKIDLNSHEILYKSTSSSEYKLISNLFQTQLTPPDVVESMNCETF